MKSKIFVLVITLVMTSTALNVPKDVNVTASDAYGDPELDHDYIKSKIENLSDIVKNVLYDKWGRYFGTDGERQAADDIKSWMENLSLYCVKKELINSTWNIEDENKESQTNSLYTGKLNKSREMNSSFYINISVYNISNNLIDYKNLTITECFPFYQHNWYENSLLDSGTDISVVKEFKPLCNKNQIEICYSHYAGGDTIYEQKMWHLFFPRYKGCIVIDKDSDNNSFFQLPPQFDQLKYYTIAECQNFFINGSVGNWLINYTDNNYNVKASYKTYWEHDYVDSYNVIGQINGTDTNKINIVGAHYDAMPGQGTIDEGAETALVLGIAKYIKDHELESDLRYTVKFIAFGAEEVGIRGAKDYIKKHNINRNETIEFVINPGNFGSYNRTGTKYYGKSITMNFEPASLNTTLLQIVEEIANALDYSYRTSLTGNGSIGIESHIGLRAEDSQLFGPNKANVAESCIQFSRSPFSGYHRDGNNHNAGDIFEGLDYDTFEIECEVVASTALHLVLNLDYQYENCSFTTVDLDGDGNNDSVNITVNMSTNNNATLLGNSIAGLYNSTTWSLSSEEKDTTLLPLRKNNITTTNLTVTLLPDKDKDNYKLNLSLFDPFDKLHDYCNQTFYLYPINKPYADFYFGQTGSKTFSFNDNSIPSPNANEISSWNWSFGDGNYSNSQNPSHTYGCGGTYDVTLTVIDDQNLSDNVTKTTYATNNNPDASFNMNANVKVKNSAITFTSTSSDSDGNILNTTWYFGDGTVGYGSSLAHSYSKSDIYTVKMVVTDDEGGVNTTTDTVYIAGALVDDSYPGDVPSQNKWDTIQEGINDIRDEELLYVYNGDYSNGITVNKSMTFYGETENNLVINCSGTVVSIVNDSVEINNLRIENATIGINQNGISNNSISNITFVNSNTGIKLQNSADNNFITNCNFTNNTYGVFISGSDSNVIGSTSVKENPSYNNSMFTLNDYGIYLSNADNNYIISCNIDGTLPSSPGRPPPPSWGICLDNSDNNTIAICDVFNATNYGIYLGGSRDNEIMNCQIRDNDKGIHLSGSSYNSIIGNNISDTSLAGVSILTISSTENSIYWNDFKNNGQVSRVQAEDFGANNNWNSSENNTFFYNGTGEGNYWSDYSGNDNDGDGIGDTAYSISGTANAQDAYPIMKEYGWLYKWF